MAWRLDKGVHKTQGTVLACASEVRYFRKEDPFATTFTVGEDRDYIIDSGASSYDGSKIDQSPEDENRQDQE